MNLKMIAKMVLIITFSFKTPHIKVAENYEANVYEGIYSFEGKVADNNMPFEYRLKFQIDNGDISYKKSIDKY